MAKGTGFMIIRAAEPKDGPAMVAILNDIIAQGGTTAIETPLAPNGYDDLVTGRIVRSCCHVAQADDVIVGFQYVKPSPFDPEQMGEIATFAKIGTVQRGIGTALFQATRRATGAMGFTVIDATIRADNTGGLAYYTKMGFQDHSTTIGVPLQDGTPVDRVHKRFTL